MGKIVSDDDELIRQVRVRQRAAERRDWTREVNEELGALLESDDQLAWVIVKGGDSRGRS